MTKESGAKAQQMVDQMAVVFANQFKATRGSKLKTDFNYITGEAWSGSDALEIGLIDEIGTLESVVYREWNVPTHDFGPTNKTNNFLSHFSAEITGQILSLFIEKAYQNKVF